MSLELILLILIIHWFADFVLQTHWQASNKSINFYALVRHTAVYSACWIPLLVSLFGGYGLLAIGSIFILHTITDYFTSRITSRLYKQSKIHGFFVVIGFDQWLHYLQLFGIYYLLI